MSSDSTTDDSYSDGSAQYGEFKMPKLEPIDLNKMYGAKGKKEPDYLDYDTKGRSVWEAAPYHAGAAYITGIACGGLYGIREGIVKAPNRRRRVLINSVLNATGKNGSMVGNSLAVLAAYYTCGKAAIGQLDLDQNSVVHQVGASEYINQVLAGASTGALYNSLKGVKPAGAGALWGVGLVGLGFAIDGAWSSITGRDLLGL